MVDLMHVSFIHILLPHFLTDGPVNVLILEVCHFSACLGTLGARVRYYCCRLWVREGFRCLIHDV